MATPLTIQSIVSDNKIYAQFSSKILPKFARNGELYVVDGILYIYTTLEGNGIGRWFPLTDQKDLFKFDQTVISNVWTIPVKWFGDNVQFIIYDQNNKVYSKKI